MATFDLQSLTPLLPWEELYRRVYLGGDLPGDPFGTLEEVHSHWLGFRERLVAEPTYQGGLRQAPMDRDVSRPVTTGYDNSLKRLSPDSNGENVHIYRQLRYIPGHWHAHDYYELVCVLSGVCPHNIAGDRYRFTAGDVALIPPDTPHVIQVLDDDAIQYNLCIRASFLEQGCPSLLAVRHPLGEFLRHCAEDRETHSYLIFRAADYLAGDNLLAALEEEGRARRPYWGVAMEAMTQYLFTDLMRHCGLSAVVLSDQGSSTENQILLTIRNHFQTITMKELQARFHYSERQLERIISAASGTTLTKLLRHLRLDYAWDLLRSTDVPVGRVIEQSGFADTSHFYRAFKERFGVTPQVCRDEAAGQERRPQAV